MKTLTSPPQPDAFIDEEEEWPLLVTCPHCKNEYDPEASTHECWRNEPDDYGNDVHNGRLLIMGCSERKSDDRGHVPAFERYDGPLWQTLRTVDPLGKRAVATFLSAHLGFGAAWHRIETYDARLTPAVAARLIAGGTAMRWPPSKPGRTPIGDYAANTIKHLAQCVTRDLEIERLPFHDVALVGGELYLQVMRAYVAEFRAEGEITARARVTEINGPIGVMRKSLREWLTTRSEMPDMSISASVVHSVRVEGDKRRSFDSRGAALRFACGEVFLSPERLHDVEARLASGRAVSWAYEYSRVHVYPGVS